eukprot:6986590-Prymnesium_polylepis.2
MEHARSGAAPAETGVRRRDALIRFAPLLAHEHVSLGPCTGSRGTLCGTASANAAAFTSRCPEYFSLACGVEGVVALHLLVVVAERTSLAAEVAEQTSLGAEVECAAEVAAAAENSDSA